MCEILAPVGNKQNLITAVSAGANAVYLGLKDFSARKTADNFSLEELKYAVAYAKTFNVKVYVTVNTLVKENEINSLLNAINDAYACGVDAFILQDLFLGKLIKEKMPNVTLHLSTQAGVCNEYGAIQAKKYGFSRVILARETKISDIERISKIIETEVFIHGALCTSLSGHCYFSSFIGGNSGNRGFCKQPCRKKYSYVYNGKIIKSGYVLSLADLCSQKDIVTLKDLGVKSFKIEGRLRSAEYVASAILLYKSALNGENVSLNNLKTAYNRGDYTRLLGFGQEKSFISSNIQGHKGLSVGKIIKVVKDVIFISPTYDFKVGDAFKIIRNGVEVGNGTCLNQNGKTVLKCHGNVLVGDSVNLTKRVDLLESLCIKELKVSITVLVDACANKPLTLTCGDITVSSSDALELAKNAPATKQDVINSLIKTDVYPYEVSVDFKSFDGKSFIVKSVLNRLRAELYAKLFYGKISNITYKIEKYTNLCITENGCNNSAIITDDFNNLESYDNIIYAPQDYNNVKLPHNKKVWLYVPAFCSGSDLEIINKIAPHFHGIYGESYWALEYAIQKGFKLFAGCGFNVFNSQNVNELRLNGVNEFCYSKELSLSEIASLNSNGFVLTNGAIEVLDLIYCPFSKNCKNCEINGNFELVDEDSRRFPVIKYKLSECRFKVFNNAKLNYNYSGNQITDNRASLSLITKGNLQKGIK